MILKCNCGNEEEFRISEMNTKRNFCFGIDNFKIKISKHHVLHIDCLKCGLKFELFA
jgi:hypothetical protein